MCQFNQRSGSILHEGYGRDVHTAGGEATRPHSEYNIFRIAQKQNYSVPLCQN